MPQSGLSVSRSQPDHRNTEMCFLLRSPEHSFWPCEIAGSCRFFRYRIKTHVVLFTILKFTLMESKAILYANLLPGFADSPVFHPGSPHNPPSSTYTRKNNTRRRKKCRHVKSHIDEIFVASVGHEPARACSARGTPGHEGSRRARHWLESTRYLSIHQCARATRILWRQNWV